jgi:hypothetical protein
MKKRTRRATSCNRRTVSTRRGSSPKVTRERRAAESKRRIAGAPACDLVPPPALIAPEPAAPRQEPEEVHFSDFIVQLPVVGEPLESLLYLCSVLNRDEAAHDEALRTRVVDAVNEVRTTREIPDRSNWTDDFNAGADVRINGAGQLVVRLRSHLAVLAHALLTLESSDAWRARLRRCRYEPCSRYFVVDVSRRETCDPQHGSAARQQRYRTRKGDEYRRRQRERRARAKAEQRPWVDRS